MDNINLAIIELLRKDSRTPFLKIAKQLNVSEGTIRKRVKDLTKSKEIEKFTINTKDGIFAIVGIETQTKTETKNIVNSIKKLNIGDIYEVTGRFDIICMVPSEDREKVNETLEKIRSTDGVIHTETFTVLLKS
jgi:Lrp/AsnC family transcriptional regulator, regulator for asnA, asnC and gidA